MDFTEPKLMQGDCLETTKFLCSSIYLTKLRRFIVIVLLVINGTFTIVYLYDSLNIEKNFILFFSQLSTALATLWELLAITVILCKGKLIEKLPQEFRLWSIDSTGEEIEQKINKEAKIVTLFTLFNFSTLVFMGLFCMQPSPNDVKYFFALYFFEKYIPEHSTLFSFLYRCTFPIFGYTAITHVLQFMYYTQHIKYQATMFVKHIECLAEYCRSEKNNNLYYDNEFQKKISRRLDFIIRRHNEFKNLYCTKKEEMEHLIGIFSLGSCLLGIGYASWVIMFYEEIVNDSLMIGRGILLTMCFWMNFSFTFYCGQLLEDELLKTTSLTSDWYLFNTSNKKKLLLFLINATKPIKIQFLSNSVNFELGLKIAKGVYAIASVVFKMKMRY